MVALNGKINFHLAIWQVPRYTFCRRNLTHLDILRQNSVFSFIMKLTQLLEALDKRGIGEALLRGGEAMQTRVDGEWKPQGAVIPIGALGAMIEQGAPSQAVAQWQSDNRCQFEQNGFLVKAARRDDRVQIAVKRTQPSTSPFTESSSPIGVAPTMVAAKAPNLLQPAIVEWYYLDGGAESGPIASDQIRALMGSGTIGGDTMVWSDGMADWKPARDSDLRPMLPASALNAVAAAPSLAPAAPIAAPDASNGSVASTGRSTPFNVSTTGEEVELEARRNKGASWFYWIVGLTIINSIIVLSGIDFSFSLGATATLFANVLARETGTTSAHIMAIGFDIVVIGFYAMCGVMASRGATWAFILGIIFFALDSLLSLIGFQIIGILIHGWALFSIFTGMMACVNLNRLLREKAITGMPVR